MFRRLVYVGVAAGACNVGYRLSQGVQSTDAFGEHTASQCWAHPLSGVHAPFVLAPGDKQRAMLASLFPNQYQHLFPAQGQLERERSLATPVRIRPLAEAPVHLRTSAAARSGTVVVGGPPALISSATEQGITYINDERQFPIAWGSAFHLEWDAPSEGPTNFLPTTFMAQQLKRLLVPETMRGVEATGQFSWRTLDWMGWITQPSHWLEGMVTCS
jgi:hypothetical protein